MAVLTRQGLYFDVWGLFPWLWEFRNALRQRPALNDFLGIFQMQPLFPVSETRWPFQFSKGGIWMYGDCFLGCETSGGPPNHRSNQCIGGSRLSHSIGHKHR